MNPITLISLAGVFTVFFPGNLYAVPQNVHQHISKSDHKKDQTNKNSSLNIGLLLPDKKTLAAKHGAELAVSIANNMGGFAGHPFHLVVRTTDGLWGAGSNESVSLVFEDQVLAYMGSLDGRNAHLAEQVATKTRVAFISTWATDMTLSYAFVPWFFRCVPDDKQQAISLIREIYLKQKLKNIALI